jgi:maltooligosyltrehalose trehalohydrolase
MDAQWIDEFHHALRVTAGGEKSGYYADFNGLQHLAKAYADAYVYDGIYSVERQKTFGAKTGNPGRQFVAFSQNHDQVGNRMLGERSSTLFSFEMQKLMAAAVMVSPYLPMIFMGEEYSEENPFLYFICHSDEQLIEAVRKGRKEEFKAFHAHGEPPDPQSEATFLKSKLNWDSQTSAQQTEMLDYYQQLIALRKSLPALHNLKRDQLTVTMNESCKTLQLHRWEGDNHVYCYMNFSEQVQTFDVPTEPFKNIFNSSEEQIPGSNVLQPESIAIYSTNNA